MKKRITISLVFTLFIGFSALSQDMFDLKKALRDIQDKYEVQFIYDDALVSGLKVGPYNQWDEKLEAKLEKILKPVKLTFSKISNQHYVIKTLSLSEEKPEVSTAKTPRTNSISIKSVLNKTTGVIRDENDLPAVGVTVLVKSTGIGTVSDIDGKYEIEVPENGILVFSYVGYKTVEIYVTGKTIIDVKLEIESTQMEEIVVV